MSINHHLDLFTQPLASSKAERKVDCAAHAVQFYRDDAFLLAEVSRFIGAALGAGDAAVIIATREHRDELDRRLKERGLDLCRAVKAGRYVALDAAETLSRLLVNGWPDPRRFGRIMGGVIARATAAAVGDQPRVAAFGEMVAILCADGKPDAAIRLEELWNDLAQTHSFSLRCGYPMNVFSKAEDSEPFARICAEHSNVTPTEDFASVIGPEQELRSIVLLEQKAQALEAEIEERKRVQQSLQRREEELRECVQRAEAAVRARSVFLSIASHELKTPVTALKGAAQLLRRRQARGELDDDRLRRTLNVFQERADHLAQLTNDLIDVARIELGHLALKCQVVDLSALIRRAVDRERDEVDETHPLTIDLPLEPTRVWGDVDRLDQVLTNLLDNAVKYSPAGGEITVQLEAPTTSKMTFAVRDRGIGLTPGAEESIFEPFGRAANAAAGYLSGMGLGLPISRGIVERHGGRIWAESPGEGGGTTVFVQLPLLVST